MIKEYRFNFPLDGYNNKKFCRMYSEEIELIKFLRKRYSIVNEPYLEIKLDLLFDPEKK